MSCLSMDVKCSPEFLTLREDATSLYGDACSGFTEGDRGGRAGTWLGRSLLQGESDWMRGSQSQSQAVSSSKHTNKDP